MEVGGCVTNFSSTTLPIFFFCFGPAPIIGSLMQGLSATQFLVGRLELTQTLNVKLRLFSVLYTVFFLFWLT